MIHFCTYFDRNYLSRGLVLYRSLVRHSPDFTLWVLCLDDETHIALTKLAAPQIKLIRLSEFEYGDQALLAAKANRSTVEYYFTCTPSLPLYVLKLAPDVETITYVDADIMFFSTPAAVLEELGQRSIGIVPHAFPPKLRAKEVYGRFNVGLLTFRNDATGRACLTQWREQCLEWCYDRLEGDRFADQKYLDAWPERYDSVCAFENPGVLMAPWNFMQFDVREADGRPSVNGRALVFYHYQGFKVVRPWLFDLGLGGYGAMRRGTRLLVYGPYVREIKKQETWVAENLEPAAQRRGSLRSNPWRNRLRMLRNLMRGQIMVAPARFQL